MACSAGKPPLGLTGKPRLTDCAPAHAIAQDRATAVLMPSLHADLLSGEHQVTLHLQALGVLVLVVVLMAGIISLALVQTRAGYRCSTGIKEGVADLMRGSTGRPVPTSWRRQRCPLGTAWHQERGSFVTRWSGTKWLLFLLTAMTYHSYMGCAAAVTGTAATPRTRRSSAPTPPTRTLPSQPWVSRAAARAPRWQRTVPAWGSDT